MKQVKYCDVTFQKAHRHHKKACGDRVNDTNDDEAARISESLKGLAALGDALFQDPPAKEVCPICFLPMPISEDDPFEVATASNDARSA